MPTGGYTIAFVILAALALMGAVWTVTLRNLFRAALSLGLALIAVAGFFLLLGAEFLAFTQILVYVGAILTLIIFGIMLTAKFHQSGGSVDRQPCGWRHSLAGNDITGSVFNRPALPAGIASVGLFVLLTASTWSLPEHLPDAGLAPTTAALGQQLVVLLVLPFEVISLVILVALIGSVALA
ncbi:MAG: NADH-quinone oxidoreductase subunit J, partial [Candidatus Omnitrophica bacterium]|nr:NADH-quinone oxidoreductase subunit J [Candidatus Omnitrophota bacterium]